MYSSSFEYMPSATGFPVSDWRRNSCDVKDLESMFMQRLQVQEDTGNKGGGEYLGELQGLDVREELPDVRLHEVRSFRIGQNLQHIVVRDKVKSWKYASLGFQVLLERQLQRLQLVVEFVQDFQQAS